MPNIPRNAQFRLICIALMLGLSGQGHAKFINDALKKAQQAAEVARQAAAYVDWQAKQKKEASQQLANKVYAVGTISSNLGSTEVRFFGFTGIRIIGG